MIAIRIQNLSRYFGTPRNIEGSRPNEAFHAFLRILGFNARPKADDDIRRTAIHAGQVLQDISLDIEEGSVVCLIGASGSGKSVLLKILAGAIPPTGGRIELAGSVSSLLGIGDNLDSRLTARENIENHAKFMRIPAKDVDKYASDVIAFAELEGFELVPVRTYSTGMILRLSIALTMQSKPSILLIDDVLGVGDIAFQQKCVDRLLELRDADCTMVLATSDDSLVQQLASRIIALGGGHIVSDGPPTQSLTGQKASSAASVEWQIASHLPENDIIALRSISIDDRSECNNAYLTLCLDYEIKTGPLQCRPVIDVVQGKVVLFRTPCPQSFDTDGARRVIFTVEVPTHILIEGSYKLTISTVASYDNDIYSLKAYDAVALTVRRDMGCVDQAISIPLIAMNLPWEIEPLTSAGA